MSRLPFLDFVFDFLNCSVKFTWQVTDEIEYYLNVVSYAIHQSTEIYFQNFLLPKITYFFAY